MSLLPTFDLLKSWMIVHQSLRYTGYLSEELRQLGGAYNRYLSGVDEAMPKEKSRLLSDDWPI